MDRDNIKTINGRDFNARTGGKRGRSKHGRRRE